MNKHYWLLILISVTFFNCVSNIPKQTWYKGNTHTHTEICGHADSKPAAVTKWYHDHGYHFLVLSEHDHFIDPDTVTMPQNKRDNFILIPGEEVTGQGHVHSTALNINKLVHGKFGKKFTVTEIIQKLTDKTHEAEGVPFLNHPNYEFAVNYTDILPVRNLHHFELHNGSGKPTHDMGLKPDLDWLYKWEKTGDAITTSESKSSRFSVYKKKVKAGEKVLLKSNGRPGPTFYTVFSTAAVTALKVNDTANHSIWMVRQGFQNGLKMYGDRNFQFTAVPDYLTGLHWIQTACNSKNFAGESEVASFTLETNGTVYIAHNDLAGVHTLSLEAVWDSLLTAGKKIYGVAADDAHTFKRLHPDGSNPGRSWIMVDSETLSRSAITEAVKNGKFYATTGIILKTAYASRERYRIDIDTAATQIELAKSNLSTHLSKAPFDGYRIEFIGQSGRVLKTVNGTKAEFHLPSGQGYLRARVTVCRVRGAVTEEFYAWCQPVFAE